MFEGIASLIARVATRHPRAALAGVIVITLLAASQGRPGMGNDSAAFAPDAPAIEAADRIDTEFGADASVTSIQFIVRSADDDVVSTDGLDAIAGVRRIIETTTLDGVGLADLAAPQPGVGALVSYLTPVEQAVAEGAPAPSDDAAVKSLLADGLAQAPPEQASLFTGLLARGSGDQAVDPTADPTATPRVDAVPAGLAVAFFEAPSTLDERTRFTDLQAVMLDELEAAAFGDTTVIAFSPELIQAAGDDSAIQIPLLLLAAVIIIALLLLLVYLPRRLMPLPRRIRRTLADTGLTVVIVLLAVSFADGVAYLLGPDGAGVIGDLAGPSSIVPILLVGLGVDYVIHLNATYRSGLADGRTVDEAMARSTKVVGGALVLSAVTTIIGFLTNLAAGIPALFDFGLYASIGIAAALVFATLAFPAARLLLDRRGERLDRLQPEALRPSEGGPLDRTVAGASWLALRHPAATVAVAGLAVVGAGITATNLESGFSFVDFVPEGSSVRDAAASLTSDFGGGLGETTQILLDGDLTDPDQWNASLGATADAASLDDVVVVGDSPRVTSVHTIVAGLVNENAPSFDAEVAEAAAAAGLDAALVAPPGADMAGVVNAARAAAPDDMAGVLTENAALFTFTTQAGTDGALALAEDLEGLFGSNATATSMGIIDATVVQAINDIQVQSLVLAIGAAGLLLALSFWISDRKPLLGLITVIPVGAVIILLFAFMVLAGIAFGPVTATLAAVVIGVGVDYTIHVTHRFQDNRREGLSIDDAVVATLSTTGSALVASALTTGIGFAVLMFSTLIPFQQFGVLTLVAILGSGLVSVAVLPSMLVLWARWADAPRAQLVTSEA